jgi:ABC-type transport system involved in multi-copper enzyme maturation permease subunit
MSFLHNIRTVSRYEAKTLGRSWFFRLFSLAAIGILTIFNIGFFSPVGNEPWSLVSNPSTVPLINLYMLNIGQAIVVIFLAADFLKRDKKLDTNEVLYTRPMSNFEYVIGKTIGILRLFLGLDIVILSIGLLMNIISKSMSIDYLSYLWYLLLICIPTILFSLGLAFLLMSVIRNQAVTFLILLGIAALDIFYLWFRTEHLFDYMAFGLPLFKSEITGFSNPGFILNQRMLYLFLGMALVLSTVLLFKRLPQSRLHTTLSVVFLFIFLALSSICGLKTYRFYRSGITDKQKVIDTNKKYENSNFAFVSDAFVNVIHKDNTIDASVDIRIMNEHREPLGEFLFSLNPGLKVIRITSDGKDLKFRRDYNIIVIDPASILMPGMSDTLTISYDGTINEPFCYPDYTGNMKDNPNRIFMVNVSKRQAFLTRNFILLTPETHWYPVASLNYYPSNPARVKTDFTRFTLRFKNEAGIIPVSQGKMKNQGEYSLFTPENPLTGLTLAAGNYLVDTLKVDSVVYRSYHFPGNDYYKKDLSQLQDTLKNLVSGIMRELETNFSTRYPFKTLSFVEVPVHFFSNPKENTQTRAEVQPSMVLLPEKLSTINQAGFAKQLSRQKSRIYFFKNNFYSSEYPVINAVFESHLQQVAPQGGQQGGFQSMFGSLSDNDRANLILKNKSFRELLAMNPGGDTIRTVLTVKGDWFFNMLRSKAGIEEFGTWFSKYIDDHRFRRVDILQFNEDIKKQFGFEFYPYLGNWFSGREQPGFLFTKFNVSQIVVGNRSRYQVTFVASNPEPVAGLFNVLFRSGGPADGGSQGARMDMMIQGSGSGGNFSIASRGRGMEAGDISKIVLLGPRESKRIGIVLDAEPRAMMINTLFAKNIPGEINLPVNDITKVKGSSREFEEEEILKEMPQFSDPTEIIVDNEDQGFIQSRQNTVSPLKKILGIKNESGDDYQQVRMWNIPEYWQPVVKTSYYGKYIRSSVYTRSGGGDKILTWKTAIRKPGYYDIYSFIGKTIDRMVVKSGSQGSSGGQRSDSGSGDDNKEETPFRDLHYKIYHDQGVEDITIEYENAGGGWNLLGRYYLSGDSAKVVLTNKSSGRAVIGDAVKWVRQD